MSTLPLVVGITWYSREDYPSLQRLVADGSGLPRTYDDWLKAAQLGFDMLQREGKTAVKIEVTPDAIKAYCIARGLDIDSKARLQFINEAVKDRYDRGELR